MQGDSNAGDSIGAQLVTPAGSLVGPLISTGHLGGAPLVAFGGGRHLLVWQDCDMSCPDNVRGQFVDPAGTLFGSAFLIESALVDEVAGIAFGNSVFLVTYTKVINAPISDDGIVFGRLVGSDGRVGPEINISSGPGDHVLNNIVEAIPEDPFDLGNCSRHGPTSHVHVVKRISL